MEIFFASYHYLILFSLLSRLGDLINRSTSRWLRQSHRSGRSGSHLRRQNAHRLLAISQAPDQSKTRVPASRKLRHEMEKGVRFNFISSKRSREGDDVLGEFGKLYVGNHRSPSSTGYILKNSEHSEVESEKAADNR